MEEYRKKCVRNNEQIEEKIIKALENHSNKNRSKN